MDFMALARALILFPYFVLLTGCTFHRAPMNLKIEIDDQTVDVRTEYIVYDEIGNIISRESQPPDFSENVEYKEIRYSHNYIYLLYEVEEGRYQVANEFIKKIRFHKLGPLGFHGAHGNFVFERNSKARRAGFLIGTERYSLESLKRKDWKIYWPNLPDDPSLNEKHYYEFSIPLYRTLDPAPRSILDYLSKQLIESMQSQNTVEAK